MRFDLTIRLAIATTWFSLNCEYIGVLRADLNINVACDLIPAQNVDSFSFPVKPTNDQEWVIKNGFANTLTNKDLPALPPGCWQHTGEDFLLSGSSISSADKEIFAIANGVVIFSTNGDSNPKPTRGGLIIIKHVCLSGKSFYIPPFEKTFADGCYVGTFKSIESKTNEVFSYYLHLGDVYVKKGDQVLKDQIIGRLYKYEDYPSKYRYAPHLHLEIWKKCTSIEPNGYDRAGFEFKKHLTNLLIQPSSFIEFHKSITPFWPVDPVINPSWNSSLGQAISPIYNSSDIQTITQRQDFQKGVIFYYPSTGALQSAAYPNNNIAPGHLKPSIDLDGWDEVLSPAFIRAYNKHGRANWLGFPYSDAGNPVEVHGWNSTGCYIQNFDGGTLGQCALLFTATCNCLQTQPEASPIQGKIWNWYRFNGGPEYLFPGSNIRLGCPITNEYYGDSDRTIVRQDFVNGYVLLNTQAGGGAAENINAFSFTGQRTVKIALAENSPLSLNGYAVSLNDVYLQWTGGIPADFYVLYSNGSAVSVYAGNGPQATRVLQLEGSTHFIFKMAIVDNSDGIIQYSNDLEIITPPAPQFVLSVDEIYDTFVYLSIRDDAHPFAPIHRIYRGPSGMDCASSPKVNCDYVLAITSGNEISDIVDWDTTYTYQAEALTASMMSLGFSNIATVTIGPKPPDLPPPPPPINPEVPFEIMEGIGFRELSPFLMNTHVTAFATIRCLKDQVVDFIEIDGTFKDAGGFEYFRDWPRIDWRPDGRPFTLGETFHYEFLLDELLPAIDCKGTINAYIKLHGIVQSFPIIQASEGASSSFEFDVLGTLPVRADLEAILTLNPSNPTTNDLIDATIRIKNTGAEPTPSCSLGISIDGKGRLPLYQLPALAIGEEHFYSISLGRLSERQHNIGVLADNKYEIAETDEWNNSITYVFSVIAPPQIKFIRGDSNIDGKVDLSDAISILQYLFLSGTIPSCRDSSDTNDDGEIDISDAVFLLLHIFLGSPKPPEPYPLCALNYETPPII